MADLDLLDPIADPPDADREQAVQFWRALRKQRPGPWASDHWNQTSKGFVGPVYVTVDMLSRALGSATVNLMELQGGGIEGDEGALLRACHALPDDDAPKLVYADFLQGRGKDSTADLIRRYCSAGKGRDVLRALPTVGANESDEKWSPAAADHPGRQVFEEPNPRQSISDILYERTLQECLTGSSYTWVIPNGYGEPCEQYVIPTVMTLALPASEQYPNGAYRIQPTQLSGSYAVLPGRYSQSGAIVPAEQVVADRRTHPWLNYDGYSPLQAVDTQIDVLRQIDIMRTSAARNGAEPSLVIVAPPGTKDTEIERLQQKLDSRFAGPWNHRKVLVLTGGAGERGQGVQVIPWSKGVGELGGDAEWEQLIGFVSAAFGVPKVITGLANAGSYAEFYAALKQFYTRTLLPMAKRIAWRWTQQLVWPFWGKRFRVQIDLPAIDDRDSLRADLDLAAKYQSIRVNELRTKLGFERLPPEQGDKLIGEANFERQQALLAEKQQAAGPQVPHPYVTGGQSGPPRPDNKDAEGSLPSRIGGAVKALEVANGVLRAKDATGREHKPAGSSEGGQFTGRGEGGGTATKERPGRDGKGRFVGHGGGGTKPGGSGGDAGEGPDRDRRPGPEYDRKPPPVSDEALDALHEALPSADQKPSRWERAKKAFTLAYDAAFATAVELAQLMDKHAPDVLDTAEDYAKISADKLADPIAAKLGISANTASVIISHAVAHTATFVRKKLGIAKAEPGALSAEDLAAAVADLLNAVYAALEVDGRADPAEVLAWLRERGAVRD